VGLYCRWVDGRAGTVGGGCTRVLALELLKLSWIGSTSISSFSTMLN